MTNFYNGAIELLSKPQGVIAKILDNNPTLKSVFQHIPVDKQKNVKKELNRALKEYSSFKNGVGIVSAVSASVLACSVITPITRNSIANFYQKRKLKISEKENTSKDINSNYLRTLPVPVTYNMFKV